MKVPYKGLTNVAFKGTLQYVQHCTWNTESVKQLEGEFMKGFVHDLISSTVVFCY